ncbi:MAG: alginate O-acetyltransferase AlgX-related protein [Rhodoferax sp.]
MKLGAWYGRTVAGALVAVVGGAAAAPGVVPRNMAIVGQDQWLYYSNELPDPAQEPLVPQTVRSLQRLHALLSDNGVSLNVLMVPTKMRLYPQHLPPWVDQRALRARYPAVLATLQAAGLPVLDLEQAFLQAPQADRDGERLFYRLDSHWSQQGAWVAAQALRDHWEHDPQGARVLAATPDVPYTLTRSRMQLPGGADLTQLLPAGPRRLDKEYITPLVVQRSDPQGAALQGVVPVPGIVLVGSSYSQEWTGFADYLRHALQREVANFSRDATQGPWYALARYVSDEAYQEAGPGPQALLLEFPLRDVHAAPAYPYREPRYRFAPQEWIALVAAWVPRDCAGAPAPLRWRTGGGPWQGQAAADGAQAAVQGLQAQAPTGDAGLDYWEVQVRLQGDTHIRVGGGISGAREWVLQRSPGVWHTVRAPLARGLRLAVAEPGRLEWRGLRLCRHPRGYGF